MKLSYRNARKKVIIGLILLILITGCSSFVSGHNQSTTPIDRITSRGFTDLLHHFSSQRKSTLDSNNIYEPQDIDLEDAAFHRSSGRFHAEWWYFEGIFDNGYSVVLGFHVLSNGRYGICSTRLFIYDDTGLKFYSNKNISIREVELSEDFPFIEVSGKQIVRLDQEQYNTTGEWVYDISLEVEGQAVQLQFQGITKGYKGELLRGWYGPVLPKATVNGTILLNGETIYVNGSGYHEHGWNIPLRIQEWGWYWGRIVSDSFSLTWGKMMQTHWGEQTRAATLSQDQSGYININPENIEIKATAYRFDHRRIIPTKFILNITDPENSIYINATMETINFQHTGKRLFHYWRYHVRINGQITYGSITEIIKDEIQIIEFMRFR